MEKYLVSIFFVKDGDAFEISNETFTEFREAFDRYSESAKSCIMVGSIASMISKNDGKLCVELYNCSEDGPFMRFEYAPYLV